MAQRILIKDAIVLSQDPSIGELPRADVLVEGDRIAEVGPDLAAADAQVIDAAGAAEQSKAEPHHWGNGNY